MELNLHQSIQLATKAHEDQWRKAQNLDEETAKLFMCMEEELYPTILSNGNKVFIKDETFVMKKPYITHPLAVMNMLSTEEEQIVGVLHDVFEKCPGYALGRVMDDSAHWIKIRSTMTDIQISERMFWMLSVLSKDKHISYDYYIKCLIRSCIIANNKVPIKVKLADIIHNLSGSPSEHARQKYMKAIPLLLNSL